jgi:hypothetical protein
MNETHKKIHLSFFLLLFMNLFYALVIHSYIFIAYFVVSLIIAYFVIYPNEFFLVIDDAKKYAQDYLRNRKTNNAVKDNYTTKNQRDIPERCKEKRDSEKVDENSTKRNNITFIN